MRTRSKSATRAAAAAPSIYWDSVDSSGGSSADSSSRNYVDPWDLENYAYLRRHSVAAAAVAPQPIYQQRSASRAAYASRLSTHQSPTESDYWYAPSTREPGYDAPASVEEIYFRPPRPVSTGCYYHQPIYEDESLSHYAPVPLYAHLSELEQAEALEELRTGEMLSRRSKYARSQYPREECMYHRRVSESTVRDAPSTLMRSRYLEEESAVDDVDCGVRYRIKPIKSPPHISYNTFGHLKIDYTNSWNSLHRKILSK